MGITLGLISTSGGAKLPAIAAPCDFRDRAGSLLSPDPGMSGLGLGVQSKIREIRMVQGFRCNLTIETVLNLDPK